MHTASSVTSELLLILSSSSDRTIYLKPTSRLETNFKFQIFAMILKLPFKLL